MHEINILFLVSKKRMRWLRLCLKQCKISLAKWYQLYSAETLPSTVREQNAIRADLRDARCCIWEWVIKRDKRACFTGEHRVKQAGGCLHLERPVGQLSARAERESGQQGAAVCTSAISSSKVNSRANKQTANIKKRYSRDTNFFSSFLWCKRMSIHYERNWRIK